MTPSTDEVTIRVLFVDEGSYHHEELTVPAAALAGHERLIDALREEQAVLERLHVDVNRLCAAWVVDS